MKDPLAALKDIHLPEAAGWWPPAPGWWLLAALLLLLVVLAWRGWRARRRRLALHDEALAELQQIRRRHAENADATWLAAELSRLLRRVAISRYPDEEVAGLVGEAWLAFLDRRLPDRPFGKGAGRVLVEAPYRKGAVELEADALFRLVERWLEQVTREERGA